MKSILMWIWISLIAALGATVALADQKDLVAYTIHFQGTAPFPTTGSFIYDPDKQVFTSFVVKWRGYTFNLKSAANSPILSGAPCGALTGGAATFALLNGSCALDVSDWFGHISPSPEFGFSSISDVTADSIRIVAFSSPVTPPYDVAGGAWTITLNSPLSKLVKPANGATKVTPDPVQFNWTSTPPAQGYNLYVGTSLGANNVIDSGPTHVTSWRATLNPMTHYYVRVWTELNGVWTNNYNDSTFTTGPIVAELTSPANAATNVNPHLPVQFTWTSVPAAKDYKLYVGTSVGATNVVNSGPTPVTNWQATLNPKTRYYVRIWTELNGVWYANDSYFTTGP